MRAPIVPDPRNFAVSKVRKAIPESGVVTDQVYRTRIAMESHDPRLGRGLSGRAEQIQPERLAQETHEPRHVDGHP